MSKRPRLLEKSRALHEDDDAFVLSGDDSALWNHLPQRRSSASTVLSIKAAASRKKKEPKPSPLLQSFLTALGREPEPTLEEQQQPQQNPSEEHETAGQQSSAADNTTTTPGVVLDAIDDASHSTLTHGQHQRYRMLVSCRQDWKAGQHKEFRRLHALVQAEQKLYRQALLEFWETHKDRVLLGFSKSSQSAAAAAAQFVHVAAFPESVTSAWKKEWTGLFYGKCCQVISLEQPPEAAKKNRWMVDAIEGHVLADDDVSQSSDERRNFHNNEQPLSLPPVGAKISAPTEPPFVDFLKHDEKAIRLAQEHKVHIMTTLETVECLLKMEEAQWMIPVKFQDNIALLELPFPQPILSPRECLELGLQQGLERCVDSTTSTAKDQEPENPCRYRYALVTLPQSSSGAVSGVARTKAKQTRILIRIPHRSLRIHAHVDYFPERGKEIPSSHERCLWILDQLLFSKSLVGRMDPSCCTLLNWEETSVAHALAGNKQLSGQQRFDPMDHWHHLAQLFQAILTIGNSGNFMLCSPGRGDSSLLLSSPRSASVHAQTTTTTTNHAESVINVEQELKRAGEVVLGSNGVRRSMRDWDWTEERAPYTFPLPPEKDSKTSKEPSKSKK